MNKQERTTRIFAVGLVNLVLWLGCSCGKRERVVEAPGGEPAVDVEKFAAVNRLEGLPGEVHRSQLDAPVAWHPWIRETLELARDTDRMIMALIALPQQPSYQVVLDELYANEAMVREINSFYVPVIIDGDAIREMGLLTADLSAEIGNGLQLPLLVWLTPDVNPVAWIPLTVAQRGSIAEVFEHSHIMVARMWREDPSYILENSAADQANRLGRMGERAAGRTFSKTPQVDSTRALRQLTSLYDTLSRSFDEAGGLFPYGAIDLLSLGVRTPGLPEELREKSRVVLEYLVADLVTSPMFDPLDGGAFSSRQGSTWSLPGFSRNCPSQARVVTSMLEAYEATGDKRALERGLGVLKFIENNYSTGNGLFALGAGTPTDPGDWLWRMEEVREVLSEEETGLWAAAAGMRTSGNLPAEVDPSRQFLRANSIAFAKTRDQVAREAGGQPEQVGEVIETARLKLLKARDERLPPAAPATVLEANAVATFRVASAYATAYRITGEKEYLERAGRALAAGRKSFSDGPLLNSYSGSEEPSLVAGRAFLYGLAINAALDLWSVSLDENWLLWADDLATTSAELFAAGNYLRESPPEADLLDLPVADLAMLFDESTAGLFSMAEARLAAIRRPLLESFGSLSSFLPMAALDSPVLYSDLIQASLVREYGRTLVFGPRVDELLPAISRAPLKGVNRWRTSNAPEKIPAFQADQVFMIEADKDVRLIQEPEDIDYPSLQNEP